MKLNVQLAAEKAGVSEQMIYLWCQEKRLPHFRMGGRGKRGRILIEDTDLDAFLLTLKVEAASSQTEPSSSAPVGIFSELNPQRLARAWKKR